MATQDPGTAAALPSAEEVKSNRKPKRSANAAHDETLTVIERVAIWITDHVGTMGFFFIILIWTALWLGWNLLAQKYHWPGVFDKPFEFLIWLFISNLLQIHLMPLIMIGQNLQARHAEIRAEQEFDTTKQTEYEMGVVLRYLQVLQDSVQSLHQRLDAMEKNAGPAS
jgi:uncharacterized membrane protein